MPAMVATPDPATGLPKGWNPHNFHPLEAIPYFRRWKCGPGRDVLYTIESTGYVARPVAEYVERVFEPRVRPALERASHIVDSYFVCPPSSFPA